MAIPGNALPALVLLLCLLRAHAHPDRCPDTDFSPFAGSGSLDNETYANGSGFASGGGSGFSCEELTLRDGVLPAFNYYCRHVSSPPPADCESLFCLTCQALLACDVPSVMYDVCSGDLLLACSVLPEFSTPEVDELYGGVCEYAMGACFYNSSTGICDSSNLLETCHTLVGLPYPCDCFYPNGTCELCELVLPLCPTPPGSGSGGGGGSDLCSYLESDEGTGYIFLCQSVPPGGPCPYSTDTCTICAYIALSGCRNFPPVTVADLCALPRLVTACDFPSVVSQSPFLEEICSFIAIGECGRNDSSCVGSHCQICSYLTTGEGLGYLFLCQTFETGSPCPYSNETCSLCSFISTGLCTNLPQVTQSDLCEVSRLVYACYYYSVSLYPTESEFLRDICPYISPCIVSGDVSGGSSSTSGFFPFGSGGSGGSGRSIPFGSGGSGGSGGDSFCALLEYPSPGLVYYCLSSYSLGECSSNSLCELCAIVSTCPDLTLPSTKAVCSNLDSISPCIAGNEDLNDYCRQIIPLCISSDDSGVCELEELIGNCTELTLGNEGVCVDDVSPVNCTNCVALLQLCNPESSVVPSHSESVSAEPTSVYSVGVIKTSSVGISSSVLSSAPMPTTTLAMAPPTGSVSHLPEPTSEETKPSSSASTSVELPKPTSTVSVTQSVSEMTSVRAEPTTSSSGVSTSSEQLLSTSGPSTLPSPTAGTPALPGGSTIDVDKLNEEQAENTISIEIEGITIAGFLEKELSFRASIADALNKAIENLRRRKHSEEFTADDIIYVGEPIMTDGGAVLVAFFAEYPEGKVVDGSVLARAVDDNSDDISDAVGGKVREIKKGVPEALRPQGTNATDSKDDEGGLSGGATVAIVVVVILLVVGAMVVVVVLVALVLRRQRSKSFEIMSAREYTPMEDTPGEGDDSGGEGGQGNRSFPLRPGSRAYEAVPTKGPDGSGAVEEGEKVGEAKDPMEDISKVTHL